MTIKIGGTDFEYADMNVKRELRKTDIRYNTQGDMLIDMVRRKYSLEVTFGLLTETEMNILRSRCEQIFVVVEFEAPEGYIKKEFHVMNEPAGELTTVNRVKLYGGVKLLFKEK
ncbi:MAG: hypothetical protein J1F03_04385 [Oscillospiraceae bacterium]|nr:hypothetical protein [Oscillospiraceae bacterium]